MAILRRTYLREHKPKLWMVLVNTDRKARDQMAWVGLVNNCRAQADEIILADLVYV